MKGEKIQKNKRVSCPALVSCALMTYALMAAGCAQTQQYTGIKQICVPGVDKQVVMEAAEEALSKMHFTIDKADAEQGVVRTRPLAGAQFFEFWRRDNVGAFNWVEANLHSIRRTAKLDISQQAGQLCVSCNVNVQRLSLPEQEVTSSAHAYGMFTRSGTVIQTLKLYPGQKTGVAWIDLGEDARLATEILKRIEKRIATRVPRDEPRNTRHEI